MRYHKKPKLFGISYKNKTGENSSRGSHGAGGHRQQNRDHGRKQTGDMTPTPPAVWGGKQVKFYHQQQCLPLGRRWGYDLSAQNDEGPWGRIQGPLKAIFAGPAR